MALTQFFFKSAFLTTIPVCCVAATNAGSPAQSVQQIGTAIRDRFITSLKRCEIAVPFIPRVVVDPRSSIDVRYSGDDRTVHLTDWNNLDANNQGAIKAWAAQGTLGLSPENMYREMFNSFIVPHELGHYLHDISGRWRTLSKWDAELEANRIGVAFWMTQPGADGRVAARIANISRFTDSLPDPTPAGQSARDFFNTHYDAFARGEDGPLNSMTYSWYQASMMKTALAEAKDFSFCQLASAYGTRK